MEPILDRKLFEHHRRKPPKLAPAYPVILLAIFAVSFGVPFFVPNVPPRVLSFAKNKTVALHRSASELAAAVARIPHSNDGVPMVASASEGAADLLRNVASWLDPLDQISPELTYRRDEVAASAGALLPAPQPSAAASTTKTIVYRTINQPVVERIIERAMPVAITGITQSVLDARFEQLDNKFSSQLAALSASIPSSNSFVSAPVFAQSQRIDNLSGTSLSNITVSGVSGLTDADIPDGITASSYLPLTGGSISGDLTVSSTVTASAFNATSTTATSTFAGGILGTRAPSVPHTFSSWSIGATGANPFDAALVVNPASAAGDTNLISASVGGSVKFLVDAEGDVFANNLTSVGSVTLSTTSASTFVVEGNTTLGDAITDRTTINGSLTVTGTTTVASVGGKFGVGTTSPFAKLAVHANNGETNSLLFEIASSTASATTSLFKIDNAGLVTFTNQTGGNATSTNFYATLGHFATGIVDTLTSALATITDLTATNLTATNATTTNSTSTNMYSSSLIAGNATTTNFAALGTIVAPYYTATSSTASQLPYASSTALTVSGTASTTNLVVSGATTLANSLSGFLKATAGVISSALVDLAANVTGILPVANGGTGWANLASGAIPYGNGASALATTTAGTAGYVLAYLNGVPTWAATTTLSTISGTLPVGSGGTGQTSFGQGWLNSDGSTISASTSPTVNYITATSTTATSSFATAGFTVGSTNLVVQQGSGNVGIGTTTPAQKFTVQGNIEHWLSSTANYKVATAGAGHIGFLGNRTQYFLWYDTTNSRVGIGTNGSTPANVLSVDAGTSIGTGYYTTAAPSNGLIVQGNVGIGTTSPATTLHIVNTIVDSGMYIDQFTDRIPFLSRRANGTPSAPTATLTGNLMGGMLAGGHSGSAFSGGRARMAFVAAEDWTSSAQGTYITFSDTPTGSTALTERMRIDSSGNVGIGTTSPSTLFAVTGGAGTYITSSGTVGIGTAAPGAILHVVGTANTYGEKIVGSGTTGQSYGLDINAGSNSSDVAFRVLDKTGSAAYFYVRGDGNVGVATNTPATTFSVSGNGYLTGGLGVGLVNSTAGTLQISGAATVGGALSSVGTYTQSNTSGIAQIYLRGNGGTFNGVQALGTGVTGIGLWANLNYDGTNYNLDNTAAAGSMLQYDNTNGWRYLYSAAGSNPRTPTELLRVTTAGNVGIGTTSPGSLLSVAGDSYLSGFYNTSGTTGGYKIDGNLILQASSTNFATLVGNGAGANITAANNTGITALGYQALNLATSSIANTGVGYFALANTQALGSSATLYGGYNTAVGFQALRANTGGYQNSAFGASALLGNTTGTVNAGFGYQALVANTTGFSNAAVGGNALGSDTTGSRNAALGESAMYGNTTGSSNVAFGQLALYTATSSSNQTAIGWGALQNSATGVSNLAVGYNALNANTFGNYNIGIGESALATATSTSRNTAIGYQALMNQIRGTVTAGNAENTALGYQALTANTTGALNTAVGSLAAPANTTGKRNTTLGSQNFQLNTTGSENVAIGTYASYYNASATNTVAVGISAAQGAAAYSAQGYTALGYQAGVNFGAGSDWNTLLGYYAGNLITTGADNIILGAASTTANDNLTTGSQNIKIGSNISFPSATASGQLNIQNILFGTGNTATGANVSTGNVGIGTTTPWRKLSVTGTVGFDGLTGATGAGSLCLDSSKQLVYNSGSDACLSSVRSTKHDIEELDLDALTLVKSLEPVSFVYNQGDGRTRYGFIAEDAAAVDQHLATYDASGTISGIDDRSIISIVVKAVQQIANTIAGFAESFATKELTFKRATGDELCLRKSDGTPVCVNGDQLSALLAGAGPSVTPAGAPDSSAGSAPDTEPPTITISGENPAHIHVGDSYADLGATVTDNVDKNLGMKTYLNGALISDIVLDTSAVATDTIDYVATDQAGNIATSTRTIVIESADGSGLTGNLDAEDPILSPEVSDAPSVVPDSAVQ